MPQDSSTVSYLNIPDSSNTSAAETGYLMYPEQTAIEKPDVVRAHLPFVLFVFFAFIIVRILMRAKEEAAHEDNNTRVQNKIFISPNDTKAFKYSGGQLFFTKQEYQQILSKHSSYFRSLTEADKEKFISRCRKFISKKIFFIHSTNSFKEMPVLVTASAIQLSFGLDKYLYPHFKYIHIYPEEFIRIQPVLCFLQGNVTGHSIRLSWKHFLKGIENNTDGQDVGLHEMAHALYYQTFVTERHVDKDFRDFFDDFNDDGNKVYEVEQALEAGLYSKYAMLNFQEFWAESVEIFFEKPFLLREKYPDLFDAMKSILNQDLS
ncbi:MAG: zinc-dependent peptidase [Gloeobacteraceae cyanobacterium ES-bin-316]|nr:zinc-dependent peptidase [Ferruginibacter sp.]